jgi:hypothetical protein
MNFALARANYKGPLNFFAYIGMLGDIAVIGLLYSYNRYRKEQKKIKEEAAKAEQMKTTLLLFPPKVDEIDYNKFSPYTPIPYYVSKTTKYQHAHIDLVGYLNENQLNVNDSYYRNYHHNDEEKSFLNDWHDPYHLQKKHHGSH